MNSDLYKTFWRLHFYAGLLCLPFLFILSVTGGIYLFKPQLENWRESGFIDVDINDPRALPNAQIASALASLPKAQFHLYRLPESESHAVQISVFSEGKRYLVYVNPYDLSIKNITAYDSRLVQWVQDIHGELLIGDAGSIIVELVASWTIVLIISGLYLWWPKNRWSLAGVLYPRLRLGGRQFWRDFHSVIGIWISALILFLLVSGLPWTVVWGSGFKEIRKVAAQSTSQDWSTFKKANTPSWGAKPVSEYNLARAVLSTANALNFAAPVELSVSNVKEQIWKVSSMNQNRPLRQDAWIDGMNGGNLMKKSGFSDKSTLDKVVGVGIAAHEGQLFGWPNQALGLLTVSAVMFLGVSGFILWRKRKPIGALGAPSGVANIKRRRKAFMFLLLPIMLLPLLALSLLMLFLLEQWVFKRFDTTRQWLGL